jgi:hypothetical protein
MMAIDAEFVVKLKGKSYPLWAGVLDAATKAGLKTLTTTVLQFPTAENGQLAVVEATAMFDDGRVFTDIGDCSPASTTPQLAPAALRLASTRAKGRCLRDAINCGMTMVEELPGTEDEPQAASAVPRSEPAPAAKPAANGKASPFCTWEGCGVELTKGQVEMSTRTFGRALCPTHQRSAHEHDVAAADRGGK